LEGWNHTNIESDHELNKLTKLSLYCIVFVNVERIIMNLRVMNMKKFTYYF